MRILYSDIVTSRLNYYLIFAFLATAIGIIISLGVFTLAQVVMLAAVVFILFFVFNRPDVIGIVTMVLMFLPLSFGTVFRLKLAWSAEPLIIILFLLVILKNLNSRKKAYTLTVDGNPFLIVLLFYIVVLVFNYLRYPLPASSVTGVAEEMGGIRFYYEKVLMFLFFVSIAYLIEIDEYAGRRYFTLLLLMVTIITLIGILILLFDPLYVFLVTLRETGIVTDATILTGLWHKATDPITFAVRDSVLWISPLGILLLMSDLVHVRVLTKVLLLMFYVAGLVLSATRSFFFGTLLALIVWAFMTKNKKVLLVFVIVAIIGFLAPGMGLVSRQFSRLLYFPSNLDQLTSFRYELFERYWNMFKENLLFGVGVGATEIGTLPPASPEYFFLQNLRFGGHGFFLGTLYTQGLVGLLPFIILYYLTIRIGARLFAVNNATLFRASGLFALMFVAYSLVPFIIGGSETYNQFFLTIGILAGVYARFLREHDKE